jgi:hypothetical protein
MTDLIARLEAAEAGARELDWLIADATDHPSFARKIDGFWPPFGERSRADKDVPAYSTSLDAALALASRVFPGFGLGMVQGSGERAKANVTPANADHGFTATASTPALALCAAILRAKGSDQ